MLNIGKRQGWAIGSLLVLILAVSVLARLAPASTETYVPRSNDEVLETLPASLVQSSLRLPEARPPDPHQSAEQAVQRARAEIERYRESADPRFLGRAEAALGEYWDQPSPPPPVLVLRARIRQSNHEFLPALADLDQALERSPTDGQALLDRASILTVLGRYGAARIDCGALEPLSAPLYALVCRSVIDGMTGRAASARAELGKAIEAPGLEPGDRCWAESVLAELALHLGEDAAGERHFRSVLMSCPNDNYARGALADVLLDAKRPAEVIALLANQTSQDGSLLRLTIAERQAQSPDFAAHLADLGQRFEEARLRGSQVHRREEARFELWLRDAGEPALSLALANFQVQREPADIRIALEAALAAKRPERAREVVAFVTSSRLEDPRIAALVAKLR